MSHRRPRKGRTDRLAGALLVGALLTAACGNATGEAGIGIRSVEADIVFGVKEDGVDVAPVAAGGDAATPADLEPVGVALSAPDDFPDRASVGDDKLKFLPKLKPADSCPPAAANEFAEVRAPLNVEAKPAEGIYSWQKGGEAEFNLLPGQKFPIRGSEKRVLHQVADVFPRTSADADADGEPDGLEFTYEVVAPEGNQGGYSVATYLVKTASQSREANVSFTTVRRSAGEPERGVVLKRIDRFDADGNTISRFQPATGLLLLPLPIRQGESWESTAVDPRSGQSITYQAQVGDRVDVDACGDIINGWEVKGTRAVSGGSTSEYNTVWATHLGGILLREAYTDRNDQGTFNRTFHIGQRTPDPMEAAS